MPSTTTKIECKDCIAEGVTTVRVPATTRSGAPVPGKRCVTHQRARRKTTRQQAHGRTVTQYGITAEEYAALKASQGGACFICGKAKGISKNLAVDHDHALGFGRHSVRCLACTTCNRVVLGRYDVAALQRAIEVLTDPPAQKFLRELDRRRAEA
ncbi:endonuclease VII [Rhodococcus phage Jflix2]|nr:endonuclease VII [Rhodococcus phage Jflix2]